MFELVNRSPFVASLFPVMEVDGCEAVMVVIKGTYVFDGTEEPKPAAEQLPLILADQYHHEPTDSSLRHASDLVPEKRGTDVVLVGSAYAPSRGMTQVDVTLEVGMVRKTVRVFGNRHWRKALGFGQSITAPEPFDRIPLTYERAFGGFDKTHENRDKWASEPRNPVGCGFIANPNRDDFSELSLPNLEDPSALISRYQDRPPPAGFGFIAPSWEPRKKYGGTYDRTWQEIRCPLLPVDFDSRFYNAAHPDLVSAGFLLGGEPALVTSANPGGSLSFRLPKISLTIDFFVDGARTTRKADLDTVVIEPDDRRLQLTWRARVRCHRKMKRVTGARIASTGPGLRA